MTYSQYRLSSDATKMALAAPNAVLIDDAFVEHVYCELGSHYILGYTFDGSEYQVLLIEPAEYVGRHGVTECHLWSSGKICLSTLPNTGWHDIEGARARGILWCTAYSVYLQTGTFEFNP